MPGKHDPSKRFMTFSLKREIYYKITQYSQELGIDKTAYVTGLFEAEMDRLGVELTPENRKKVEEETRAIREQRCRTWSPIKSRTGKEKGKNNTAKK